MPQFKFRLEAALKLAERELEKQQRSLAVELEKLYALQTRLREQEKSWQLAIEGQKEAGVNAPQDLALWQAYTQKQLDHLRVLELQTLEQERNVMRQRQRLLEAHQDAEKLKKLREKQRIQYVLKEQRREQAVLDELSQVVYGRRNHE